MTEEHHRQVGCLILQSVCRREEETRSQGNIHMCVYKGTQCTRMFHEVPVPCKAGREKARWWQETKMVLQRRGPFRRRRLFFREAIPAQHAQYVIVLL